MYYQVALGVISNVRTQVRLNLLSPSTSVQILFLKEYKTDIYFVNYYQPKKHIQHYKIKKLLCKAIGKCQNTKRSSGDRGCAFGEDKNE